MHGRTVRGRTLRGLRERAGVRTRELAREVICSEGHLRNIETSDDQPSGLLAHRLARALSRHLNESITIDDFSDAEAEQAVA